MIEFISLYYATALVPSGQFPLFPDYAISPGDVGIVVEEDEQLVTFLMGNAVLCVEKSKEGDVYVCS